MPRARTVRGVYLTHNVTIAFRWIRKTPKLQFYYSQVIRWHLHISGKNRELFLLNWPTNYLTYFLGRLSGDKIQSANSTDDHPSVTDVIKLPDQLDLEDCLKAFSETEVNSKTRVSKMHGPIPNFDFFFRYWTRPTLGFARPARNTSAPLKLSVFGGFQTFSFST